MSDVEAARWISLERAASLLDYTPGALRRTLERRATLGRDGVTEASFDGVRARKFANRWRVQLGTEWTDVPAAAAKARSRRGTSASPTHAIKPEKE